MKKLNFKSKTFRNILFITNLVFLAYFLFSMNSGGSVGGFELTEVMVSVSSLMVLTLADLYFSILGK